MNACNGVDVFQCFRVWNLDSRTPYEMIRRQRGGITNTTRIRTRTGFYKKTIYDKNAWDGFKILWNPQIIRIQEVGVVATNKTHSVLKALSSVRGMRQEEDKSLERVKLKSFTYEKTFKSPTSIKRRYVSLFFIHMLKRTLKCNFLRLI